jgi:hypothetical protein
MTVSDLIDEYKLGSIRYIFARILTLYGYGSLDEVSAGVLFDYFDTKSIFSSLIYYTPLLRRRLGRYCDFPLSFLKHYSKLNLCGKVNFAARFSRS